MQLILYTKTGCSWCAEVLSFLREKKIPFEERKVQSNPVYFAELKQKSGQEKTPTVDLDGEILADTDTEALEVFLRERSVVP